MRKLIHVSDLHFGKSEAVLVDKLIASIKTLAPHLVVISGDLTQRARKLEFESAVSYIEVLRSLSLPVVVIPGNHDITPLYSPVERIFNTYNNYRKYISEQTAAQYSDRELAITSINSVSPVRPSGGHFRVREVERAGAWLSQFPDSIMKIVVTHHPIHTTTERPMKRALGGNKALKALQGSKIDLFLAGHYHKSMIQPLTARQAAHGGLAVQAGTVSRRLRGEPASFNVLTLDKPHLTFESHQWDAPVARFAPTKRKEFSLQGTQWMEQT